MTPQNLEFARRAVACPAFQIVQGMHLTDCTGRHRTTVGDGFVCLPSAHEELFHVTLFPDFDDPVTVLSMLQCVRLAARQPDLYPMHDLAAGTFTLLEKTASTYLETCILALESLCP